VKLFGKDLSRRALIKVSSVAAGAGLLSLGSSKSVKSQMAARKSNGPRALALVGDRYHNPDYIRVSLDKVFKELNILIDYTVEYDKISADLLKNYQLLLIFRDGQIFPDGYLGPDAWSVYSANLETPKSFPNPVSVPWMTPEQGLAIKNFVNAGNGFYAFHNCSHISLSNRDYRDVMGGAYISHPPLRPFQVRPTENKHPITDGITPFMVTDEQHYVIYDKDPKYQILESENIDGFKFQDLGTKSIAGWAYDYGKGRVVFTAVGHTIHAMWNPQYLEIQKRSVRWLLKQI
jgi:type 1 glutamine amidotransferase